MLIKMFIYIGESHGARNGTRRLVLAPSTGFPSTAANGRFYFERLRQTARNAQVAIGLSKLSSRPSLSLSLPALCPFPWHVSLVCVTFDRICIRRSRRNSPRVRLSSPCDPFGRGGDEGGGGGEVSMGVEGRRERESTVTIH